MIKELNVTYLISTDEWFVAPDGEMYKAVFGTVTGLCTDADALGIKTNRGSTNWYVQIGDMMIAGCQVHYCMRANSFSDKLATYSIDHEGKSSKGTLQSTRIYNANKSGL